MQSEAKDNAGSRATSDSGTSQMEGSQSSVAQNASVGDQRDAQTDTTSGERRRKIAETAYYRAERRGFAPGSEDADWLEAEQEVGRWQGSIKVEELNKCLRNELSAIETYQQALAKNRARYGQDANFERLGQILNEHREAAARLRTIIEQQGGTPSTDSGAWGTWSKTVMGAAKLLGDKAALKALKEGEEAGLKQYQRMAQDGGASAENIVSSFIGRQHAHIQDLDRLIETA